MPRLVGLDKGAEILRTGRPVSSKEAVEIRLIYKEFEGDLIDEGIELINQIYRGILHVDRISKEPFEETGVPPDVNIGHLSKKIDNILVRAIYQGATKSLEDGLDNEARLFGECINTEDMKIGI